MKFSTYDPGEFYDELFEGIGRPRRGSALLLRKFASLPDGELRKRQQAAERVILNMGMTFGVYGSDEGHEQIFPFDIVPRIVEAPDWTLLGAQSPSRHLVSHRRDRPGAHQRRPLLCP